MNLEINKYITKRYDRWKDYSDFHCTRAGIRDESVDVLNEVLLSLLQKDETKLLELFNSKKGQYTELDFYLLNMIKMNALSPTAPYRAKNKKLPVDANVDYQSLELEDTKEICTDIAHENFENHQTVCRIVDRFDLNKTEKEVFKFVFFMGEQVLDFSNNRVIRNNAYPLYSSIRMAVSIVLFQEKKIKVHPKGIISSRTKHLIAQYNLTKTIEN